MKYSQEKTEELTKELDALKARYLPLTVPWWQRLSNLAQKAINLEMGGEILSLLGGMQVLYIRGVASIRDSIPTARTEPVVGGNVGRGIIPAQRHYGSDIGTGGRVPLYAMMQGEVKIAQESSNTGYGGLVVLKHPPVGTATHVYTLYAHLHRVDVQVGQQVTQTTQLGITGGRYEDYIPKPKNEKGEEISYSYEDQAFLYQRVGESTGHHLHFELIVTPTDSLGEIYVNANKVQPMPFLPALSQISKWNIAGYLKMLEDVYQEYLKQLSRLKPLAPADKLQVAPLTNPQIHQQPR